MTRKGKCERGDACECTGKPNGATLRIFCEHYAWEEQPRDDLDIASAKHFASLPEAKRTLCVEHLRGLVPTQVVDKWREQHKRGVTIGSDDIRFHHGVGMNVRNALRGVVKDDELPSGNWDDYYMGALEALVT